MPTPKKRRTRSPHPGIVLIPPDPAHGHPTWRARCKNPDTGKLEKVRLDPTVLSTAEARRQWAIRQAKTLARRTLDLEAGAPRFQGMAIAAAIERYYEAHQHLKLRTLACYRKGTGPFLEWCETRRIRSCDDLTSHQLVAFRDSRVKITKRVVVVDGRRGAKRDTAEPRAPMTVNQELRGLATVLEYVRRSGFVPKLSSDGIRDGLRRMKSTTRRITFMQQDDLKALIVAALKHDAATFRETRAEHASRDNIGSTTRYPSVAPCLVLALMTGLRFQHLLALEWRDCDLAVDEGGAPCGFVAPSTSSLTKRSGTIDLSVATGLHALLVKMRAEAGERERVLALTAGEAQSALRRLIREFDAPPSAGWQCFRRTCGCYIANAGSLFGGASAWRAAKWLGHGVQVSERHYLDVVRVPREAKTLEAAMGIEGELQRVIDGVGEREGARQAAE